MKVPIGHLESSLKPRLLGPAHRVSDSVGLGWGLRLAFLRKSQVMVMLLLQGHFQNHC